MLKDRNRLAHDYDGTFAATRFQVIVDEYYHLFVKLRDSMEKYYQDFDEMNTLQIDRFNCRSKGTREYS